MVGLEGIVGFSIRPITIITILYMPRPLAAVATVIAPVLTLIALNFATNAIDNGANKRLWWEIIAIVEAIPRTWRPVTSVATIIIIISPMLEFRLTRRKLDAQTLSLCR